MIKILLLLALIILTIFTGCTFPDIPGLLSGGAHSSLFYGPISIFMWIFFGVIYFMPTIIAVATRKSKMVTIFMINAFLGWTIIGWIIALILARI